METIDLKLFATMCHTGMFEIIAVCIAVIHAWKRCVGVVSGHLFADLLSCNITRYPN